LELGRGTDKEIASRLLNRNIACTLPEIAPSQKDGVTLDELIIGIFPDFKNVEDIDNIPHEEFVSKEVKVSRAIDLLKKRALEAIVMGYNLPISSRVNN
jgi:hypothetical protein